MTPAPPGLVVKAYYDQLPEDQEYAEELYRVVAFIVFESEGEEDVAPAIVHEGNVVSITDLDLASNFLRYEVIDTAIPLVMHPPHS